MQCFACGLTALISGSEPQPRGQTAGQTMAESQLNQNAGATAPSIPAQTPPAGTTRAERHGTQKSPASRLIIINMAGEGADTTIPSVKKKLRHKHKPETVKGKPKAAVSEHTGSKGTKTSRKVPRKSPAIQLAKAKPNSSRPPPHSRVSPGIACQQHHTLSDSVFIAAHLFGPGPAASKESGSSLQSASDGFGLIDSADRSLVLGNRQYISGIDGGSAGMFGVLGCYS